MSSNSSLDIETSPVLEASLKLQQLTNHSTFIKTGTIKSICIGVSPTKKLCVVAQIIQEMDVDSSNVEVDAAVDSPNFTSELIELPLTKKDLIVRRK